MQILISLLPFQNLQAYLKFQWVDEGIHKVDDLMSQELIEFLFTYKKTTCFYVLMFLRIHTQCLQMTCNLYFAPSLVILKLDYCKHTSQTLVKMLSNMILTIFYMCSATPVILYIGHL